MSGLKLYTGNRLERLAEDLARVLSDPLSSPMQREVILVQSRGMERWLSMELARHQGICANCRFPFPNRFVYDLFRILIPGVSEESLFEPEIMTWKIMQLLPSCLERKGFETLRGYLEGDGTKLRLFQLSSRIADLFDQYVIFRPEMILGWDQGAESHWQAVLWREVSKGIEGAQAHRAALQKIFLETVQNASDKLKDLPERIAVFGISAVPPFHLQVLAAVSRFIEVNLFLLNPCREYWADIVSGREMRRVTRLEIRENLHPEELHLEKGNSLLASTGRLGRDFFDLVTGLGCEEHPSFVDPGKDTLLRCVQSDILNLIDRGRGEHKKKTIAADASIQIHSCHSPMREVEVLQDRLLNLFASDPALLPRDIVIMTPDIETYAPYIQAAFSLPSGDPRSIPFSIADQGIRKESRLIDSFLSFLELPGSRMGVSQILAVLESPAVRRRFDLEEADLALIHTWVRETRIRWGIDGRDRKKLGLPEFSENTWRAGLDRLLLGYALPGRDEKMFMGILPYDDIEGSDVSILGKFLAFMDRLFRSVAEMDQARSLEEWGEFLLAFVDGFFLADRETEQELHVLRRAIHSLAGKQAPSGFRDRLGPEIITSYLRARLEGEGFGYGFLTGGMTFCAMLPMRSIPFKVVCLLGMNDDAYPRQTKSLGFDLMAKMPRPGDRSRRKDDRYLFLETLLSARERLHISYVGQSIQDNSPRPPSVLVSELLDYIDQGYELQDRKILEKIVVGHRLQAFSPEYFKKGGELISYSGENYAAARKAAGRRADPAPFIPAGLPEPEEWKDVDLDRFCRFFVNPARFLLNNRLGIYLDDEAGILEENEPFDISGLDRYRLEQNFVKRVLQKLDLKDYLPAARASGQLPHGVPGEWLFAQTCAQVDSFARLVLPYIEKGPTEPLDLDLNLDDVRLHGRIGNLYPDCLLFYRYANVRPQDRLNLWIYLQILNLGGVQGHSGKGILVCKDRVCTYAPGSESEGVLKTLVAAYRQGLMKPLHFFPRSSFAYAQSMEKYGDAGKATAAARKAWEDDFGNPEANDPYFRLCFRNADPLDDEFRNLAAEIFGPILKNEN